MKLLLGVGMSGTLVSLGTAGYRVARKFQKSGTAGYRVPKFQNMGTEAWELISVSCFECDLG